MGSHIIPTSGFGEPGSQVKRQTFQGFNAFVAWMCPSFPIAPMPLPRW